MSAKLPAALGIQADAASLSVTQSTEDRVVQAAIQAAVESMVSASSTNVVASFLNDNTTTNIGTGATGTTVYTMGAAEIGKKVHIVCTFGRYMEMYINGTKTATIPKGGFPIELDMDIPALATVAFKSIDPIGAATAITAGEITVNILG